MADINIEKKSNKKPIWPWILGLLLLIGVIWVLAEVMENEPEREEMAVAEERYEEEPLATDPQANPVEENNPQAESFVVYVHENLRMGAMGEDPEVIREGLMRLSAAIGQFSQHNTAHEQQIEEIRQTAQQIEPGSPSEQHAEMVKSATSIAALVLRQIQQNQFPDAVAEVTDLQEQARAIDPTEQLSEQKGEVEAYFEKAADVIEKMQDIEAGVI